MSNINKHGLNRYIQLEVKRQVRMNSKFGCVMCRSGFYQYEHIDPSFEDAKAHDADAICCLCGSCHDAVTRGRLSKESIKSAYEKIKIASIDEQSRPVGPLDFHNGNAEIVVGGIQYSPAVKTLLRYNSIDLIKLIPGGENEPGRISAIFTDENGNTVLWLIENEWIGALENWDIDTVGQRITVKSTSNKVALQLRLDPPGKIVIEHLDMRFQDAHILISEQTYAIGRYLNDGSIFWGHSNICILTSTSEGAAFEFTHPDILRQRDNKYKDSAQSLGTSDRNMVMSAISGVMHIPYGIAIASLTGTIHVYNAAFNARPLDMMRKVVFNYPDQVLAYIGSGKFDGT